MTHDELLARISRTDFFIEKYPLREALRAVVELHKPFKVNDILLCECEPLAYPCPTIRAIEKELN